MPGSEFEPRCRCGRADEHVGDTIRHSKRRRNGCALSEIKKARVVRHGLFLVYAVSIRSISSAGSMSGSVVRAARADLK